MELEAPRGEEDGKAAERGLAQAVLLFGLACGVRDERR